MKKMSLYVILAVCLLVSSGCETYSAVKQGDLTIKDIKTMVNYGFSSGGKVQVFTDVTQPVQTQEATDTKKGTNPKKGEVSKGKAFLEKIFNADSWLYGNLW